MRNLISAGQILVVESFDELVSTPFNYQINAICWQRKLKGDFAEIVKQLAHKDNMSLIKTQDLEALNLSEQGQVARSLILNDMKVLTDQGALPVLNLINFYERDEAFPFFPTDVYSYHVDRSPIPTSTFLCTYYGAATELLPNTQAVQKISVPEIREELKKHYNGAADGFDNFLQNHFFDLHYQALPGAQPVNTGSGHLWRLAVDHPESKVLPCIHRAPKENTGEPRLLLIC